MIKISAEVRRDSPLGQLAAAGATGVIIPVDGLSADDRNGVASGELAALAAFAGQRGLEAYALADRFFTDRELPAVEGLLSAAAGLEGIYYADPAVYQLAKERGLAGKLIYSDDAVGVSGAELAAYLDLGIRRAVISPDISGEEVIRILHTGRELEAVAYGQLRLALSRRRLLSGRPGAPADSRFREESRSAFLTAHETDQGTVIYEDRPLAAAGWLPRFIAAGLSWVQIRGAGMAEAELIEAVRLVKAASLGAAQAGYGAFYDRPTEIRR